MDGDQDNTANVPAVAGDAFPTPVVEAMPMALALYLDDKLYERVSAIALRISKAAGVTPKHLIGQPEACFAVVSRALTWKLDPFAVGMATFATPGGQIGFEGKLIHSIIDNSGKLEPGSGGVHFEHYGDWSKVQGKFELRESKKQDDQGAPKKYAAATWTDADARAGKPTDQAKYPFAQSCGVRVIAKLRGEAKPRILDFDLIQAQPRNSTLWATDPMTQICYTAVRRFGSVIVPSLIMGVPFDPQDNVPSGPVDVTAQSSAEIAPVPAPRSKTEARAAKSTAAASTANASAKDVDPETGEVQGQAAAAAANGAPAAAPPGDNVPASAGMVAHIRKRLETATLTEAECCKKFAIERLDGITVAQAQAIIAWSANPAG